VIFQSSIRKELSQSFATTLVVLLTVVMSNMLIQTLGQASRGAIHPADVMQVMCFTALGYSATLLTLSLFIAIISTLSRMYVDNEMAIWFSSGQRLSSLASPVLRFSWPILLCILISALMVWPWSNQHIQDLKMAFESRNDIERLAPGKFQEFSSGTGVFFVDKDTATSESGRNVFVSRTEGDWNTVISAKEGGVERIQSDKFLSLHNGQQFSINAKTHESRLINFEKYQLLINEKLNTSSYDRPLYAVNSLELLSRKNSTEEGELFWRIGQFFCAFNLTILGIALSTVNPRAASSYQIAKAILIFILYYNSINLGQRWISEGRMPLLSSLIVLHGAALLLAITWIKAKESNRSIKVWLLR